MVLDFEVFWVRVVGEEGMVAERPRKKEKRHLTCTSSKSRLHGLILLLSLFNSVQQ